jgi:hypothetical protein
MQAGRLIDIKPCSMKAVPLVLGHQNAQPTMFYVHLRSTVLDHARITLNGDSESQLASPWGRCCPPVGAEGLARDDRGRQAIGSGPPGTIATACQPSACRSSTNVE